ncbi:MAG: GPP34 family phosphoprotein [Gemmatimonadetes bacterium]|nr:GPP34 family phosphoprotein [Gemmatimonadota bacterium]
MGGDHRGVGYAKDLDRRLPLQEGLFLLGLRSDKGSVVAGWSPYILGGALLAELVLRGRVEIEKTRWKTRVMVLDARTPTRDRMLNECLTRLRDDPKPRSPGVWIGRFTRIKDLRHRVAGRLCQRGILRAVRRPVFLVFRVRVYPETDARWKEDIALRLRCLILSGDVDAAGGDAPSARTMMLLSLAEGGGLLRHVLSRKERKSVRRRVKELVKDEPVGRAVKQLVQQAAAAASASV